MYKNDLLFFRNAQLIALVSISSFAQVVRLRIKKVRDVIRANTIFFKIEHADDECGIKAYTC